MSQEGSKQNNTIPKIVYQPKYQETQLEKFRKYVEIKHNINLDDYWELHEWSCRNFPEFWDCVWHFFGVISSQPYEEVFDRKMTFDNMEWFRGARFNYAENVFKYKDSHVAIIATDSSDNEEFVTYREMYEEVCQYSVSLRSIGIRKGDFISSYMANKKEAVFAFLATASIGAAWCGANPILGVKGVVSRFRQVSPKVMFTSGNFRFAGHEVKMLDKLKNIVKDLPSLEKIVFVPSKTLGVKEDISHIPKCCTLKDFLENARTEYKRNPWDLEYEQVPFDYPLNASFTSGTTGQPKGLIQSAGAFFATLKDFGLHQDITRKDILINFSPVGWITWNLFVNTLHLGVTVCLYEGYPFDESPTRYWDLIDKLGITSSHILSRTAEEMEKNGLVPTEKHSLKTLRQIFPLGSIMKPRSYEFFPRIIPGIFVQAMYGTTEVMGMICGMNRNLPVYKGEMHCFSLGMDVKCLDENGKEVIGQKGNLVLANPYPAMPVNFLHDESKENLRRTYLSHYPGYWYVGDEMWINPKTKGFIIYGRCDETLNPKGARFNCSEIYFALEEFPGILDCVCVSQFNRERDERVVLFVKMKPGHALTEEVQREIRRVIEDCLTYDRVPEIIIEVPDIPYNLNRKKLNLMVKRIINKMPIPNADDVANPDSLEFYKNVDLGDF